MPVAAHAPMICPAAVAVAPVTLMRLVVVFSPAVGAEKVTVPAFAWVRPLRVSVWMLPPPPAMSLFKATFNCPPVRATAPMVSA